MLNRSLMTSFVILTLALSLQTTPVSAAELPRTLDIGQSEIALNGSGVRQKSLFKLYVGGLYLTNPTNDATAIINANEPMAIRIEITSGFVSQAKMAAALSEGFENSTNGKTAALKEQIDQFQACFADDITKSDVFSIVYLPSRGVVVSKNGRQKGVIEGLAFKQALFGIWLGDNPADAGLKKAMLRK